MIVCFSGTGNSRYVAERLAESLGESVCMLEHERLREFDRFEIADRRVIWVFPTYSWGVPPVVVDAMRRSRCTTPDAVHMMVTTCGDDTGRTAAQWRRLMRAKGYRTGAAYSVTMPNTYTLMKGFDIDSSDIEQAKLQAAPARIDRIAKAIEAGGDGPDDMLKGRWALIKSGVIYPWFVRYAMSPKPFHAISEQCTRCGLCARSCPCDNISMDSPEGTPVWSDNCAMCLRCYHSCPSHAVAYGRATIGKGQYMLSRKNKP